MKKKLLLSTITFLLVFSFAISIQASSHTKTIDAEFDKIKVTVDGAPVATPTIVYDGVTYVPLRAVSEMLEATVDYDAKTLTAKIGSTKSVAISEIPIEWEDAFKGNDVDLDSIYQAKEFQDMAQELNEYLGNMPSELLVLLVIDDYQTWVRGGQTQFSDFWEYQDIHPIRNYWD